MREWIRAALVRAIKTAAQAAVISLPTTTFAIGEVDWGLIAGIAAGGFVLSIVTSLAGIPEANDGRSPFASDDYENGEWQ